MTAKRSPRYWAQWGRMRHYVANVATTNEIAHHLLDRRIQAMKLQYSLAKKVENERKAGARINELNAEVHRLRTALRRIADLDGCQGGPWPCVMSEGEEPCFVCQAKTALIPDTDSGRYPRSEDS